MTDAFTTAARAEAEERWNFARAKGQATLQRFMIRREEFQAGAVWARDHLAAQDSTLRLPDESEMEVVGEWLVVRGAQEPDCPAGPEYGPDPYSDAAPLVHLSQVAGYPPEPPEPTDAEVEAAAEAAFLSTGPSIANGMSDDWANADEYQRDRWRTRARAALAAARTSRQEQNHGR